MAIDNDVWDLIADLQEAGVALGKLRQVEREALFLHSAEYTAEEIGCHTGKTRGTVLSLIYRARLKLKGWTSQQREVKHG